MKKLISIILVLIGFNINAQEITTDWNELDGQTTLKKYIQNQAYEYLEFRAEKKDSISKARIQISHSSRNNKIIIRDNLNLNNPLIIINQYPLEKLTVLEFITLDDIEKIDLSKSSDKLSGAYGILAKYGLINITMDRRKWRKLKRKYGR